MSSSRRPGGWGRLHINDLHMKTPNEGEEVFIREAVHGSWRKLREISVPTNVPNLGVLEVELNFEALVWVGWKLDTMCDGISVDLERGLPSGAVERFSVGLT